MIPTQIHYRDPADLRLHPLQKAMPEPDKGSPEWHSFVDGLAGLGPEGTPALICTREGLVMDGGRRWRAARQLQWPLVPVIERPEYEAASLMVDSLFGQRNMTRGAKAYLAVGLLEDWAASSERRRLENLKRGVKTAQKPLISPMPSNSASKPETIAEICARWGISRDTYEQARRVHSLFHDPRCRELGLLFERAERRCPNAEGLAVLQKELQAELEPELLDGRKNLWNVASALGSRIATADKPRPDQLEFWNDPFLRLQRGARQWEDLPTRAQEKLLSDWRRTVHALPADLRAEMLAVLQEVES